MKIGKRTYASQQEVLRSRTLSLMNIYCIKGWNQTSIDPDQFVDEVIEGLGADIAAAEVAAEVGAEVAPLPTLEQRIKAYESKADESMKRNQRVKTMDGIGHSAKGWILGTAKDWHL